MAYIFTCEGCKGRHIKFIEQDNELLTKGTGKQYSGVLALQIFDDRDDMRITFADAKNVYAGAAKRLLLPFSTDYLCHFDFNDSEIKLGKKKIELQTEPFGSAMIWALMCYDFTTGKGCTYLFPDKENACKWAKKIGLTQYKLLDNDGRFVRDEWI